MLQVIYKRLVVHPELQAQTTDGIFTSAAISEHPLGDPLKEKTIIAVQAVRGMIRVHCPAGNVFIPTFSYSKLLPLSEENIFMTYPTFLPCADLYKREQSLLIADFKMLPHWVFSHFVKFKSLR